MNRAAAPASKRSTNCKRVTPASRWPETSKGGIGMADRIRQATEIADKLING